MDSTWNKRVGRFKKKDILGHYMQYSGQVLKDCKGHRVLLLCDYGFRRFEKTDIPIRIETKAQLKEWIRRHAIEIYVEVADADDRNRTDKYIVDIDVSDKSYQKFKQFMFLVAMRMRDLPNIKGRIEIRDTGGRGWHLILCLDRKYPYSLVRRRMKSWINKMEDIPKGVRLDISSMKEGGAIKVLGCLNAKSGAVCTRIN